MGLSFGVGGSSSKSSSAPWGYQAPYLKDIWHQAQDLFNKGPYQGDYAAPIQPGQTQGAQAGQDLFGLGQQVGQTYGQYGQQLAGGLNTSQNFYNDTLNGGNSYQNPLAGGINMDLVNQVANDPNVNGQIDAALRDPYRQLSEQILPGNAINAIDSGNSGSSRRQMADSIAQRGYADRASDVGAQIRGDAYNRGLDFASQYAGYQDQGQRQDFLAQQNAAGMLNQQGNTGLGYLANQYDMGQSGAQNLSGWGDYLQQLQQGQIQGQMDQWNSPMDLLNAYAGIVQRGNWGGTTKNKGSNWNLSYGNQQGGP